MPHAWHMRERPAGSQPSRSPSGRRRRRRRGNGIACSTACARRVR